MADKNGGIVVRLRFFASSKDLAQCEQAVLELNAAASRLKGSYLLDLIVSDHPK